jgi:hypothetical protein
VGEGLQGILEGDPQDSLGEGGHQGSPAEVQLCLEGQGRQDSLEAAHLQGDSLEKYQEERHLEVHQDSLAEEHLQEDTLEKHLEDHLEEEHFLDSLVVEHLQEDSLGNHLEERHLLKDSLEEHLLEEEHHLDGSQEEGHR